MFRISLWKLFLQYFLLFCDENEELNLKWWSFAKILWNFNIFFSWVSLIVLPEGLLHNFLTRLYIEPAFLTVKIWQILSITGFSSKTLWHTYIFFKNNIITRMWVEAKTRVNYPIKDILVSMVSIKKINMSILILLFRGWYAEFPIMD